MHHGDYAGDAAMLSLLLTAASADSERNGADLDATDDAG